MAAHASDLNSNSNFWDLEVERARAYRFDSQLQRTHLENIHSLLMTANPQEREKRHRQIALNASLAVRVLQDMECAEGFLREHEYDESMARPALAESLYNLRSIFGDIHRRSHWALAYLIYLDEMGEGFPMALRDERILKGAFHAERNQQGCKQVRDFLEVQLKAIPALEAQREFVKGVGWGLWGLVTDLKDGVTYTYHFLRRDEKALKAWEEFLDSSYSLAVEFKEDPKETTARFRQEAMRTIRAMPPDQSGSLAGALSGMILTGPALKMANHQWAKLSKLHRSMKEAGTLKIEVNRLRAENLALQKEIIVKELEAITDPLTQAFNRGVFTNQRYFGMIHRLLEKGKSVSVLRVDVNSLKTVNDILGHGAGDQLILGIAQRIRHSLRMDDFIFIRDGGDEFFLVLPETKLPEATQVAQRLRSEILAWPERKNLADELTSRARHFTEKDWARVTRGPGGAPSHDEIGSLSIGVAQSVPDESVEMLLKAADNAQNVSKQTGKTKIGVRILNEVSEETIELY